MLYSMNYSMNETYASTGWSTSLYTPPPALTSTQCAHGLTRFFSNQTALAIATEASSHPSGLASLYAQPWVYAGGGLGNMDECIFNTCLAGAGVRRDSLTFAAVCMVDSCSAQDLAAKDFVWTVTQVSQLPTTVDPALAQEYVTLLDRIAELNKFLDTGWICGEFIVPFSYWPFGLPYVVITLLFVSLAAIGTFWMKQKKLLSSTTSKKVNGSDELPLRVDDEQGPLLLNDVHKHTTAFPSSDNPSKASPTFSFWSAFDLTRHLKTIVTQHSPETAVLDGLRAGSIFWIVMGHVMAIVSSSGPGYSNPANFLPPDGLTATVIGQLLFSSRLAVDTFLVLSGFLVVYVVDRKLPRTNGHESVLRRYGKNLPGLVISRVVRIMPLYAMTLGFYTQIAPHLGSGPFWYQWLSLLQPCADYGWTNFLFLNNFVPWDLGITETCFYHSWYLAVDLQLFVACTILVFWYQANAVQAQRATLVLCATSIVSAAYLAYVRQWSVNTFDGAAVARFDVEAYAKPHVRAQAYLMGMYVAMILPKDSLPHRTPWQLAHHVIVGVALAGMALVTFGTATGAYARRPCQYWEWPHRNQCGSEWPEAVTFWYTATSRAIWNAGVAIILYTCLGRNPHQNPVASILSWPCWTPLSQLTFGVYLIHPMVIFVWQLGAREKHVFRLFTFGMDYLSVCVVSFVVALAAALIIEFPCSHLWRNYVERGNSTRIELPEICREEPIYGSVECKHSNGITKGSVTSEA